MPDVSYIDDMACTCKSLKYNISIKFANSRYIYYVFKIGLNQVNHGTIWSTSI